MTAKTSDNDAVTFDAELRKAAATKKSLDLVYQVNLETDDASVLALGALPADTLLRVTVEVAS